MGTTASTATTSLVTITTPAKSAGGNRSEILTQFGNALQGLYISWKHETANATGDAVSGIMEATLNFHWYNNDIATGETHTPYMLWQIDILNPDAAMYKTVLRDTWQGTFVVATTAGAPPAISVKMIPTSPLVKGALTFYNLVDAHQDTASVFSIDTSKTGGVNDLTLASGATANDELCKETWTIGTTKQKCVRA